MCYSKLCAISAVLLLALSAGAQPTNVMDPNGDVFSSTSDMGYYWSGFGVGLMFFGFGIVLRMAKRTTGTSSDF